MRLSVLDNGMVVEHEDGERMLVVRTANVFGFIGASSYGLSSDFEEDMISKNGAVKINKVYKIKHPRPFFNLMEDNNLILFWERGDKLEKAKQLLSEHFGKPVDNIIIC